jgi:hypothetical protein
MNTNAFIVKESGESRPLYDSTHHACLRAIRIALEKGFWAGPKAVAQRIPKTPAVDLCLACDELAGKITRVGRTDCAAT